MAALVIDILGFRQRAGFKSKCPLCESPIYGKIYDLVATINNKEEVIIASIDEACYEKAKDEYKLLP